MVIIKKVRSKFLGQIESAFPTKMPRKDGILSKRRFFYNRQLKATDRILSGQVSFAHR
mgnify:CR=1 FL=1